MEKEVAEKAEREDAEIAAKEAAEKVGVEVVGREQDEAEVAFIVEAAQKAAKNAEKIIEVAMTQGESSTTNLAPLVIKTLEEL